MNDDVSSIAEDEAVKGDEKITDTEESISDPDKKADDENTDEKLAELEKLTKNFFDVISEDSDCLYVFSTKGIGDFIMAGGLSYAAQERKGKKSTILVIQDKKWDTGILFPNVTAVMHFPLSMIGTLDKYFNKTGGYEGDNYIYANIRKKNDKYLWSSELNMLERFKKDVFKIPVDTPLIYPFINELSEENVAELQEKYTLDFERTIILSPHANTFRKTLNNEFWIQMAQRLKEKNYILYTNVAGDAKPIEATEPLKVNFAELYYITDKVKCFIGLRSGVFDFLAMTDAKTLNIMPLPHWYWDISFMFPGCNNRTFYDTTEYTEKLSESLSKYDVSINIKYAHKRIPLENIFYSHAEIIDEILKEVEKI